MNYEANMRYGEKVAASFSKTGHPSGLNALIADMGAKDSTRKTAGEWAFYAAMRAFSSALGALEAERKVSFAFPPCSVERLDYLRNIGGDEYRNASEHLIASVQAVRRTIPGWHFTVSLPSVKAEDKTPPTPAKPDPVEVRVIAMPARETTTTIKRDKYDNILSTTQIEADIP